MRWAPCCLVAITACYYAPPDAAPRPASPAVVTAPEPKPLPATYGLVRGTVTVDGEPVGYFGVTAVKSFVYGFLGKDVDAVRSRTGAFALGYPAGDFDLLVVAPDIGRRAILAIHLEAGATVDLGAIAIPRGYEIRGRTIDDHGDPVANARVVIGYLSPRHRRDALTELAMGKYATTSDARGAFTLHGVSRMPLSGGNWITASFDDLVAGPRPVPDHDAEITLQLAAP